ncbi:thiolase family protein [Corynebacterium sanguinis]|uniref:thiolase family protein n=1 Tax=Corynebacterium sanguinis TaxID=2594913 RepID=UPI0011863337|nr:acetyl-CoA C-acyltransferase [Corynebacterium sanguinis]MCT1411339.1 acetyl-CoA C-acyltransferase [Corynebacterium sanguinis]MCT1444106.1 acetyl-CoA C-acyltransferase [Corynebacterium sanguinis]MCT1464112.1 acetyl-CoA C-acyltransferase [Corynebacterium sanguinis]MCT1499135.1 acetyl-CoA C-acyltransferase [Corynebacterium sanguinis]MCT2329729.1 acetyl-CoA C-acyltransferase [Corynebacterium sanguinis]
MSESIYITNAKRTPIGTFGGSLSKFHTTELGAFAAKAVIDDSGVPADQFDSAVWANVVTSAPRDLFTSRSVALEAGLPQGSHAYGVNRLCGSGVQAAISAAQQIHSDDSRLTLVGGVEVMSQAPYSVEGMRQGRKMGDGKLVDWLTGALTDPMGNGIMGITAENVAAKYGISRERQDEFALQSQTRAADAIANGRFEEQIIPVGDFTTDEHPRQTSAEKLAGLRPSFAKEGTVTPGNSSGINDAAAALVLTGESGLKDFGLNPLAKIVSWGVAGCDPKYMGLGPTVAVPRALDKAGLKLSDIKLIESNEAFAAQAIAVSDELGFDNDKTNINGGAIALGHPIGATGVILITKLIHSLKDAGGGLGLVTACIGGGQGIALILEV